MDILEKNGLVPEDLLPRDRVGELEEKQVSTKQDVNTLADTVLALCDIIEGGE